MKHIFLFALLFVGVQAFSQNAVPNTVQSQQTAVDQNIQAVFQKRSETIQLLNTVKDNDQLSTKDLEKIHQYSITLKRLNMLDYSNPKITKRALKSLRQIDKSLYKMID